MKKPSSFELPQKILKYSKELGGIFSTTDLFNIINEKQPLTNKRRIQRLESAGILTRIKRGIYVTEDFDLWRLAAQIRPQCYISMFSILATNGFTGTVPQNTVSVVCLGLQKNLTVLNKQLNFYSIKKGLFFGFTSDSFGVCRADNEKAYLDVLYYYNRGYTFAIDPLTEIRTNKLNKKKVLKYLEKYKNPKFKEFVKGRLNAKL